MTRRSFVAGLRRLGLFVSRIVVGVLLGSLIERVAALVPPPWSILAFTALFVVWFASPLSDAIDAALVWVWQHSEKDSPR